MHDIKFDFCNQVLAFERLNMSVVYKDSVRTAQKTLSISVIRNQSANDV